MLTRVLIILVSPATNGRLIHRANSVNNIDKVIVSKRVGEERYDVEQTVNQPLVYTKSLCSSPSAEPQPGRQLDSSSLEQPGLFGPDFRVDPFILKLLNHPTTCVCNRHDLNTKLVGLEVYCDGMVLSSS